MPIETGMYSQNLAPDIMGSVERGMGMKRLRQQNKSYDEDQQFQTALKEGAVVGEDGQVSYAPEGMARLAGLNPQKAMEMQNQMAERDQAAQLKKLEMYKQKIDTTGRLLSGVKDQASYANARAQAIKLGIAGPDDLPAAYDPGFVENIQMKNLSYKEQLEHKLKLREVAAKEVEAGAKRTEAGGTGGIPKKLSSEDRKRLDNIKMAKKAVMGMSDAFKKGDFTFSLVGDNDFTMNMSRWNEALGRMQSGGAITEHEAKSFKAMMPRPTDNKEIQKKKLQEMAAEMDERLSTFNIDPEKMPGYVPGKPFEGKDNKVAGTQVFNTSDIEWK